MDTVTIELAYYWYVLTVTMVGNVITKVEEYNSLSQKTTVYTPASDNWNKIVQSTEGIMLEKGF